MLISKGYFFHYSICFFAVQGEAAQFEAAQRIFTKINKDAKGRCFFRQNDYISFVFLFYGTKAKVFRLFGGFLGCGLLDRNGERVV
ncbi:MAG: hypothetical protein IKM64_08170 [Clostridia bacterium]|nr:hypothetical protein [Clostridia bacterium]